MSDSSDEQNAELLPRDVAVEIPQLEEAGAPTATNDGDVVSSPPRRDEEDEPPRRRTPSTTAPTTTSDTISGPNDSGNDAIIPGDDISRHTMRATIAPAIGAPPSVEAAASSSSLEGETLWREMQSVQRKLRDAERNFPTSTVSDEQTVADASMSTTSLNQDGTAVEAAHPPQLGGDGDLAAMRTTSMSGSSEVVEGERLWCEIQQVQRKLRDVERNWDDGATLSRLNHNDEPMPSSSADQAVDSAPTSDQDYALTAAPPIADLGSISDAPSSNPPHHIANHLGSIPAAPSLRRDRIRQPTVEPGAYRVRPQGRIRVRARRVGRRNVGSDGDDDDDSDEDSTDYEAADEGRSSVPDGSTGHSHHDVTDSTLQMDAGLVRAEPIDEEDVKPAIMAQATPFRRKLRRLAAILLIVVLIVTGIVVAIVLTTTNNNNNGGGAASPTSAPTSPVPLNMSVLLGQFFDDLPAETVAALEDANSSQAQAYQWMNESIQLNSTLFEQDTEQSAVSRMTLRFALATLYFATSGPAWSNRANWLDANVHECDWAGCTCSTGPGIAGLNLAGHGLDGTVPLEISLLTSLNTLVLESNTLKGTLPSQLGLMSTLERFQGGSMQLQGTIPAALGSMNSLVWLDLSQNQLKGPIPPTLGQLSRLSQLALVDNSLTGGVPSELGLATNLARLQISGNDELTGTVPSEVCALVPNGLDLIVDCGTLSCDCCGC